MTPKTSDAAVFDAGVMDEAQEKIAAEHRRLIASGAVDQLQERLRSFVQQESARVRQAAVAQQRRVLLTAQKRGRLMAWLDHAMRRGFTPRAALLALIEGRQQEGRGQDPGDGFVSVAARRLAYEARFVGALVARLDRDLPNWFRMADDPVFTADVVRELHELRPGGKPGSSQNRDAETAAKALADALENSRQVLNGLGADLDPLDGWAGPQLHDPEKLLRVGAPDWAQSLLPKLDRTRNLAGLSETEALAALGEIYQAITIGRGNDFATAASDTRADPATRDRAQILTQPLHFKDAEAWLAYHRAFGRGDILSAALEHQRRAARLAAQMEFFGPDPARLIRALCDKMNIEIDGDAGYDSVLLEMQGLAILGTLPRLGAELGSGRRALWDMVKLGSAVQDTIADLVTAAAGLTYRGAPIARAYCDQVTAFLNGQDDATQSELAFLLGEACAGLIDHLLAPVYAADAAPGQITRALARRFKYAGPLWWEDLLRGLGARLCAAWLGARAGADWTALDPSCRDALARQGFTAPDWQVLRQAVVRGVDGQAYLTPEALASLQRADLALRLRRLFADRTVMTPPNAVLRFFTRLKGWPIATPQIALTQPKLEQAALGVGSGEIASRFSRFGQIGHLGHLIAGLLVAGLVTQTLGHADAATAADSAAAIRDALRQAGGTGLYGDFLFGQFARFGESMGDSDVAGGLSIAWQQARAGAVAGGTALEGALNKTRFRNLWYSRPILDFLILNAIQESLTPGFHQREAARRMSDDGQVRFLPRVVSSLNHGPSGQARG